LVLSWYLAGCLGEKEGRERAQVFPASGRLPVTLHQRNAIAVHAPRA